MRKFLAQVVALLLVALIAAPAASAQAEKVRTELSKVTAIDGKLQKSNVKMPRVKEFGPDRSAQFSKKASEASVRALLNRRNAKFAPALAADTSTYKGVVVFSDLVEYVRDIQMFEFSVTAPVEYEAVSMWNLRYGATFGAVMGEEYYYVTDARINNGTPYIASGKVFDPTTWELVDEIAIDNDFSCLGFCAAYDPATGNIYKIGYKPDGSGLQLGIFDPESFTSATIAEFSEDAPLYMAMSFGLDGTMYVMDDAGNFGTMDKTTAKFTLIKATGLACEYYTSGAIDHNAQKPVFYYSLPSDAASELYAIDCATGDYSLVYEYANAEEIVGMYFNVPLAEATAPAKPALNSVDFVGQALTGTVSFTAPAALYNGDAAPAGQKLNYEIVANGKVVQTGSNLEYGHSYKVKVDMTEGGLQTFTVVFYNEVGPSPKSNKVTVWLGKDTPDAVKNVEAAWAAGKMTLTWDEVTEGAHEGTLGNVTYAVYNAADSTLIKDALTENTYTFDVKEPEVLTEYQYYVVAISDGLQSEAGFSNVVKLGNFAAPFSTAINSSTASDWTIINSNDDNKKWTLNLTDASVGYSSTLATDDWLITTPIIVKQGYLYTVTVSAKGGSRSWAEKFEVKAGNAATAAAMTLQVIEPTEIMSTTYTDYTGKFIATSNKVYIGIHGISDPDNLRLYVNELSIDGGIAANAPAEATDLNILVPYSGENKATLTYTAPTLTVAGDELAGANALTRVEVLVNGKIQYVDNQPTAGAVSSIEIPVPTFGVYEFEVIAYNATGAGVTAKASAYVGINVPGAPANVKVTEVSDGNVNITWDKVTVDADGNVMNPDLVKYTVAVPSVDAEGQLVLDILAENLTANELNGVEAVAKDEQDFVQYAVVATTEAGQNIGFSGLVAVGTPYALPYNDTFADAALEHILAMGEGDNWALFTDESGIVSRNGDNGFIACNSPMIDFGWGPMPLGDGFGELITGKIAVTEKDPELSFYFLGLAPNCPNTIETEVICDGDTTSVDVVETAGNGEWVRHAVDMKAYAGKTVQLLFRATLVGDYFLGGGYHGFIDDIRLGDPVKVDVVAKNISAPATVDTEKAFEISYTIYNQGTEEAKDVHVSLYANGNLVENSIDTLKVAAGQTVEGKFNHEAFTLFEPGTYEFSFVVDCEADQDLTNNTSNVVTVKVNNRNFPTVQLAGVSETVDSTATVKLSWETPAIDISYYPVIEDFESASYPIFTTDNFGGWTLRNFNTSATYPISNGAGGAVNFPNSGTAFGWILMDYEAAGLSEGYAAYEGNCYMAAFAHQDAQANDAWLISPAQLGVAQTVKFMAKAMNTSYGAETMECYYSTTGTEVADFTKVEIQGYNEATGVTLDWVEYSIDLPAGAVYFAIRSTGRDVFMLCVDNVTYLGQSPFLSLELKGYDVYRNQEKITKTPLTVEEYTDVVNKEGKYDYTVVAVYNDGNSAPSNVYTVDVEFSGIADALAGVKVAVEGDEIVVSGAEVVTIASVDGKLVYNGESGRVAVAPGVYVVKADATTAKVIVK